MKFTLNRNFYLATTKGRVFKFEKGVPKEVPESCWEDALRIGAVPEDPDAVVTKEEQIFEKESAPSGKERADQIMAAMVKLERINKRGDFTAGGRPHIKALARLLGYDVFDGERDELWMKLRDMRVHGDDSTAAA